MSQLLNLSRAAHLIGVPRGVLQKKIRDGEIQTYDGMVATEELLRVYPDLSLEESGAFERVTKIKEQSFGRRVRERMLPSQEILAQRLVTMAEELSDLRRHLARYHHFVEGFRERIDALSLASPSAELRELGCYVDEGLGAVLGSEEHADALEVMDDMLHVMTAHIKVKPSGREFFVEGSETILKAALRAGLAPSYGCGNGNCGLCKARVIEGQVRQTFHYDYPLSAAEKAQNYTLLCSHTAASDLVIEMIEADSPADIPRQEIVAKVKFATPLDAETMLLHVQTPRANRMRFFAGQSVTLGVAGGTADFSGEYPLASCPCDDRNLLFHIARDEEDEFSVRLFAGALHPGDPISVRGPWGNFVLKKDSPRPILFACCDNGFAPVASLIEHAIAVDVAERMTLAWATTRPDGHYAAKQCHAWEGSLDNFRFLPVVADGRSGAGAALLDAVAAIPDLSGHDAYVAGPADFVDAVRAGLMAASVPADRIVSE